MRPRDGFGLIELIVALTLLSVGVLALAAAAVTAQASIATADATERAARTAAMVLDSLTQVAAPAAGSRAEAGVFAEWEVSTDGTLATIALRVRVRDGRQQHRFDWQAQHVVSP